MADHMTSTRHRFTAPIVVAATIAVLVGALVVLAGLGDDRVTAAPLSPLAAASAAVPAPPALDLDVAVPDPIAPDLIASPVPSEHDDATAAPAPAATEEAPVAVPAPPATGDDDPAPPAAAHTPPAPAPATPPAGPPQPEAVPTTGRLEVHLTPAGGESSKRVTVLGPDDETILEWTEVTGPIVLDELAPGGYEVWIELLGPPYGPDENGAELAGASSVSRELVDIVAGNTTRLACSGC